jgi:hypothetical protein
LENLKGTDHLRDQGVHERIKLILIPKKEGVRVGTGFNWLKTGSSGGLL